MNCESCHRPMVPAEKGILKLQGEVWEGDDIEALPLCQDCEERELIPFLTQYITATTP